MSIKEDRPVSAVVSDIVGNVQEIVRSEVRLAKAQMKSEARDTVTSATRLACGVVVALYAVGLFLLAAVFLLSQYMPAWLAASAVCLVAASVAAVLIISGRRQWSHARSAIERPINVTKENVLWMNAQTK